MANIFEQLANARVIVADPEYSLFYAWSGGSGIHAYTAEGVEADYWQVDGRDGVTETSIRQSIAEYMTRTPDDMEDGDD